MNISVIIPVYNEEKVIADCLSSLQKQTVKTEIIVVDDGSTDKTESVVKSLNSPLVKWISRKHSGLPAVVRNRGIKKSNGNWLAFLDSDDSWNKDKLERQLELVNKLQLKASCTNAHIINPLGGKKNGLYFSEKEVKNIIDFSELLTTNFVICSSLLVEKDLVEECGKFPEEPKLKAIEDYALWLRLSTKTRIAYLPKPLVNYFDDKKNGIRNVWQDVKLQKKVVFQNFLEWSVRNFTKNQKQLFFIFKALGQL